MNIEEIRLKNDGSGDFHDNTIGFAMVPGHAYYHDKGKPGFHFVWQAPSTGMHEFCLIFNNCEKARASFELTVHLTNAAGRYHIASVFGHYDATWEVVDVCLRALRGTLLFAVTTIIAVSWISLQPDLPRGEKVLIYVLGPVQLVACLLKGVLDEESTATTGFMVWYATLHLIDFICFFAIVTALGRIIIASNQMIEGLRRQPHGVIPED
eukprot:gene11349-13413_t